MKLKFGFQNAKKCLDFCILSSHFLPYVHIYTKNALNAICSTFLPILTFLPLHKIYQNALQCRHYKRAKYKNIFILLSIYLEKYIREGAIMQARLKVFKSGNSLALRLPKSLNLHNVKEFILKSFDNNDVVLTPVKDDEWSGLFKTLNELKDAGVKFERAEQSLPQERNFGFK